MNFKLIRIYIVCISAFICTMLSAQKIPLDEYKAEIGLAGGGSYYLGEANSVLFSNLGWAVSPFLRYRFDPRLSVKAEFTVATVNGILGGAKIKNTVSATDLTGEFNFFDLEKNEYKKFSKIFSPYIFAGVGYVFNSGASIPFGVGMKVKLEKRWNLNVQWSNRLLFVDNLEGNSLPQLNNPNNLNGSNIFNNDLLSTFTVGISYDIWKKKCDCENSTVKKDKHKYKQK